MTRRVVKVALSIILTMLASLEAALAADKFDTSSPIKIGWIGPLTGPASALGVDSVPAIELVFEKINAAGGINGRPIELLVEDDRYETAKTVTAYKKLVKESKVNVIVVITYGGLFAVAESAQRDGVIIIDPLDCDDQIAALPNNILCVSKKTEDLGFKIAELAINNGDIPSAILAYNGDAFMETVAKSSQLRFKMLSVKEPEIQGYAPETADFKPMLLRAKAKGVKSIFFFGYDEMGFAMRQARELQIAVPFYAMNTITSPGCLDSAGQAAEEAYVVSWLAPRTPQFEDFIRAFEKKVGRKPFLEISTIPSFDVASLLVKFLPDSSNGTFDLVKLRNSFYGVKNYEGVSGKITIDPDGITRSLENKPFKLKMRTLVPYEVKK